MLVCYESGLTLAPDCRSTSGIHLDANLDNLRSRIGPDCRLLAPPQLQPRCHPRDRSATTTGVTNYFVQCYAGRHGRMCFSDGDHLAWLSLISQPGFCALRTGKYIIARIYAHIVGNRMPKRLDFPKSLVDRYGSLMPKVIQSQKNIGHKSEL